MADKELKKKIKELSERIDELEKENSKLGSKERVDDNQKNISRREFLKKSALGLGGLAALTSPVSADYFIKDDSFSVQTSNDGGSTLTEGLFVDQSQNVEIPRGNLTAGGGLLFSEFTGNYNINRVDPAENTYGDRAIGFSNTSEPGNLSDFDHVFGVPGVKLGGNVEIPNGDVDIGPNKVKTSNFEITENSSTNSLDFNYTG